MEIVAVGSLREGLGAALSTRNATTEQDDREIATLTTEAPEAATRAR
jgi:pantothenate synthetase